MMKMINLMTDPWIPVLREDGTETCLAPWQIAEPENPVVALAAPRPDFNGALMQFQIGLLQTAATPQNHNDWADWLEQPPSTEELKARFCSFSESFELSGDGPCFMQDFDPLEGEPKPISALLIDAPGGKSLKDNTDHFVKRGEVTGLCAACAATALFTLQTNAPSGGVGHRTSLRGGGPLTTLVVLDPEGSCLKETLWRNLWLNVLDAQAVASMTGNNEKLARSDIFPWLAPTRTSESKAGCDTTPKDAHPLQMFWGMPRRTRLDWSDAEVGECDLCGKNDGVVVRHYVTTNYGINYSGAWQHPLSPHYIDAKSGEPMPVHAQPGGLGYRHWLGWAEGTETMHPASVVSLFREDTKRRLSEEQLRLWAFGYDMDNMKPRCWYETTFPLFVIPDEMVRSEFSKRVQAMVDAAMQVSGFVQTCVKEAWFKRPADVRGDTRFLKEAFFQHTETAFYALLVPLKTAIAQREDSQVLADWHTLLSREATALFDYWAARGDIAVSNPRRIAQAHQKLGKLLHGRKLLAGLGIKSKEKAA